MFSLRANLRFPRTWAKKNKLVSQHVFIHFTGRLAGGAWGACATYLRWCQSPLKHRGSVIMGWKRWNILETQRREIKLWTSEACCPHLRALHIHECMSGSLSQRVSMKGHLQTCESATHYVARSSSLNEQILTRGHWVQKDPETVSLTPVQAEAINSFHLRLPDFQRVKTPKA